jgi:aminocarboxymuconate-semialdehyde decarboxylase
MSVPQAIDVHAHILSEETISLIAKAAPVVAPKLTAIDQEFAMLEIAGTPYRPYPRGGFDLERRLRDMDAAQVDMQVLSNTPQTFLYHQDPAVTATCCRIQNEQIAKVVAAHPDRFLGIATLPMQAPQLAADELRHAMGTLDLRGAHIGSNVQGCNLDDPALEPVWATAAELGAFILVHPMRVAGADRLTSYYLTNLIGNPLDTTIAVASLVFGGVLERHPNLTFCFAHGGGFAPYQAGRFAHSWQVRNEPKVNLTVSPEASLARLHYDTILHSAKALEFLVGSVGADHVLLGSDYPFDMGMMDCARFVRSLDLPAAHRDSILAGRAKELLGGTGAAARAARA